jgi:hypothetical protein
MTELPRGTQLPSVIVSLNRRRRTVVDEIRWRSERGQRAPWRFPPPRHRKLEDRFQTTYSCPGKNERGAAGVKL